MFKILDLVTSMLAVAGSGSGSAVQRQWQWQWQEVTRSTPKGKILFWPFGFFVWGFGLSLKKVSFEIWKVSSFYCNGPIKKKKKKNVFSKAKNTKGREERSVDLYGRRSGRQCKK